MNALKLIRDLINTYNIFAIGLHRFRDFLSEHFRSHNAQDKVKCSKGEAEIVLPPFRNITVCLSALPLLANWRAAPYFGPDIVGPTGCHRLRQRPEANESTAPREKKSAVI